MHSAVGVHPDPKVPGRGRWVQMGAPDENSDRTKMMPLELGGLLKNNINHLDGREGPRRLSRSMSSM